jgi:hypothetical protein
MTMFPPGIQRVGPVKRWPPQKVAAVKVRLEKARKELLATLETLRGEMLTQKEADGGSGLKTSLSRCAGPF